ncbi:GDSL esterase/lipase At2g40250-like [Punica granatum]|uniref:Uncharacterized protein n=2 Tax=Punica granatum TaxID=22663 RepID=A0A218WJS0_PUNGR|nr:GDSL esterase/lipase At2g40250-like [Punica granatum]OWM72481.1 hypothetical protein CDL15_Pgr018366 [Punica granatum]PKI74046.1 hypothetical protein CRG98_005524 [Punica granatum]
MASATNTIILSTIVVVLLMFSSASASRHDVTAIFAIGDSTLDPGNNNHIGTLFVSNHPPYGCDFPGRVATGRFTNGRLVTDVLSSHLGLKQFLPAYLDPALKDEDLLTGVSFASAGSGIDDETTVLAHLLSLESQVRNFKIALRRIERKIGPQEAKRIINNALFVISSGTNDILNNFYWLPVSHRKLQFSLPQYHDFLLERLENIIQDLHSLGARKFLVAGMPPTGCLPLQMTAGSIFPIFGPHTLQRRCVEQQNSDSQAYNVKLQALITKLSSEVEEAKFAYADIYRPLMDIIQNPSKEGFDVSTEGCCGIGLVETGPLCLVLSPKCTNPSRYVFWDSIHPTEAAYSRIAEEIIKTTLPKLVT